MGRKPSNILLSLLAMGASGWALSRLVRWLRLRTNDDYFAGKVVVITGASRGLGRSLAEAFAARGANLVLAARSADDLQETAAICSAITPHIQAIPLSTDVTVDVDRRWLVDETVRKLGRIDVFVNNAGVRQGGAFLGLTPEQIRQTFEVNLLAGIQLAHLVLPIMVAQGNGHLVNIASAAGRHTEPYFVPYGTTKHGIIGYSEGLRREFASKGVHVMVVNPGYIRTDMVTEIGPVLQRMGFMMISPELIARRTLQGIILRKAEVRVGLYETFGGYVSVLFPELADLYWRILMPRDFPDAAARQR